MKIPVVNNVSALKLTVIHYAMYDMIMNLLIFKTAMCLAVFNRHINHKPVRSTRHATRHVFEKEPAGR